MPDPILEIDHLSISFLTRTVEIPAVMDFSCTVMPGEAMGLVGESGCGKSTVALAIMRDLTRVGRITKGAIRFKGRDMGEMSEAELRALRGARIAMVYQEPMASLNPTLRVGQQLMEVPLIHERVLKSEARRRALDMVKAVRLPDPERILRAYPHQLSGGQQQRIVIAMALLANPELIILDEPTTALDVTVEAGVVELVKELTARTGAASLFISHNLGLIRETCDRVTVMYSGEAVETGRVVDVFGAMRHPYTQGLFRSIPLPGADKNTRPLVPIPGQLPLPHMRPPGCHFAPRCAYFVHGACDMRKVPMAPVTQGHESRCLRLAEIDWRAPPQGSERQTPIETGPPVLVVEGLKKHYHVAANAIFGGGAGRTVKAVEDVSFVACEAEVVAVVGESGCGKSTFAKVALGLETASAGGIAFNNQPIGQTPVERRDTATISSIQMIFQNPFDTLNPSYTVGSQILRTLDRFAIGGSREERRETMYRLLDLVKLPRAFADRMPRQLSGGQKQRIGVARAFAGRPRVIVADEPMSALDVSVQAAISELLMSLQREARTTMVFISHDLSVVRYLADRVVVMYLGHVVESGATEQIFAPPFHPYTEALLSAIPIPDPTVVKRHVVLEGEIPSAMAPPPGCPFQTRCPMKREVAGNLCEREAAPMRAAAPGHAIKCHLPLETLRAQPPMFSLAEAAAP